jgi:hypothetical protein
MANEDLKTLLNMQQRLGFMEQRYTHQKRSKLFKLAIDTIDIITQDIYEDELCAVGRLV